MAIPKEYRTPEIERIEAIVFQMSPDDFGALPPLAKEDLNLIGVLIQTFNFVDLNLRRALDIFLDSSLLSKKKLLSAHDLDVFSAVKDAIAEHQIPTTREIDVALAFRILEYGREVRNLAAHFAGKRFPSENVIVFISRNDRDAKQSISKALEFGRVTLAVIDRQKLQELVHEIVQCSDWLANQIPYWSNNHSSKSQL